MYVKCQHNDITLSSIFMFGIQSIIFLLLLLFQLLYPNTILYFMLIELLQPQIQIEDSWQQFRRYDKNNDGTLDLTEVCQQ